MRARLRATLVLALVAVVVVGCQTRPPLTEQEAFVLEQDLHCDLHGRPTPEGELVGLTVDDCISFDVQADGIRNR